MSVYKIIPRRKWMPEFIYYWLLKWKLYGMLTKHKISRSRLMPIYRNYKGWTWFARCLFFSVVFTKDHKPQRVVVFFKLGMAIHIKQYSFVFDLKGA